MVSTAGFLSATELMPASYSSIVHLNVPYGSSGAPGQPLVGELPRSRSEKLRWGEVGFFLAALRPGPLTVVGPRSLPLSFEDLAVVLEDPRRLLGWHPREGPVSEAVDEAVPGHHDPQRGLPHAFR